MTFETLKSVVEDPHFTKIVDIHLRMKENGYPHVVPEYLIDLTTCTANSCFLIIYTFITGKSPSQVCRYSAGFIPLPALERRMREQGLGLSSASDQSLQPTLSGEVNAKSDTWGARVLTKGTFPLASCLPAVSNDTCCLEAVVTTDTTTSETSAVQSCFVTACVPSESVRTLTLATGLR
jgi:hypothetical protein